MRLRTRLVIAGLSILAVATVGALLIVSMGGRALEEQAFEQLTGVREAKAEQIENEITEFFDNLDLLAHSVSAREGLLRLPDAREDLGAATSEEQAVVDAYYVDEFAPRVLGETLSDEQVIATQPESPASTRLQYLYLADNPWPVGRKDLRVEAGDGSEYSAVHAEIHPFFSTALNKFGAYDIFLIDNDGYVVYTVFKEVDFGTNLATGPLSDSGLAKVWKDSVATDDRASQDFEPYLPSYNAPAAFAARPVLGPDGDRIGTIAMQLPVDRINSVMTSNGQWAKVGLGESGETYLVADDLTMRNDSRFLIEDPVNYFEAISSELDPETVRLIEVLNSTIALQIVDTVGTRDALLGNSGEQIFADYRDVAVLSSYRPLALDEFDFTWAIMSEIDEAEAFAAEYTLMRSATVALVIIGTVLIVVVVIASGRMTQPLHVLEKETVTIEEFDFTDPEPYDTTNIDRIATRGDEIGDLAGAFSRMTDVLGENVRSRVEVEGELNVAAQIQESMLPLTFPSFPENVEFQLHARLTPAKEIGGDFFEHGFLDESHFFFAVGDVSGKGVPAALFMAAVKTLIRSGVLQGEAPAELLTRINAELSRENPEMMFATVWLGVIDLGTGVVDFVNAGHNPPVLVTEEGTRWLEEIHGPMVGPIAGIAYEQGSLRLDLQSALVVYSDGVTEAMSPRDVPFGEERLAELVADLGDREAEDATAAIVADVLAWEAGSVRSDDVTVMVFRYLHARREVSFEHALSLDSEGIPDEPLAQEISAVNERLSEFARAAGVSDAEVSRARTALDEVLVNSASYSGSSALVIRAWAHDESLTIEVADDGEPFDPLQAPEPDVDIPLAEREIGGLGIHILRNILDDVTYAYKDKKNTLTMQVRPRRESE
jgi:serine phosphatase RsbU (regulator of sigma subunit)/anti-sigma regulatory factor (Ser/Thr protein kinase)